MKFEHEVILYTVIVYAAVAAVWAVGYFSITAWICYNKEEVTERRTKFVIPSGCYIEVKDRMIPIDNYREIDDER